MRKLLPIPLFTFVWITIGLVLGVLFSRIFGVQSWMGVSLLSLPVFLFLYFRRGTQGLLNILLLTLGFLLIGLDLVSEQKEPFRYFKLEEYCNTESFLEAEIKEFSRADKDWRKAILQVDFVINEKDKIPVRERMLCLVNSQDTEFKKGDIIRFQAGILPIKNKNNPGEFDAEYYWSNKGISKMVFLTGVDYIWLGNERNFASRWLDELDRKLSIIFEKELNKEELGIAKALILGDKDHLSTELVQSFGSAGAMHILAVSGLHVGLILQVILFVLSQFPKYFSKYQSTWIAVVILLVYAALTGFSASVCRAVLMFGLLAIARTTSRTYEPLNVLFASAFVLLIFDANYLFDIGFQLSYLAMIGIFTLYRSIEKFVFFKAKSLRKIWGGTAIGIAATLLTFPLTLYYFHQFPNYFILSNILLMVLTEVVLFGGIAFISFSWLPGINKLLIVLLSFSIYLMIMAVRFVEALPWSVAKGFNINIGLVLFIYGFMLLCFFLYRFKLPMRKPVTFSLGLTCFLLIVFGRFESFDKNELVVFNDNHCTILLRKDNELFCFVNERGKLEKAKYLVSNYEKLFPGEVKYVQMTDGKEFHLQGENFQFKARQNFGGVRFSLNEISYSLIRSAQEIMDRKENEKIIYYPWVELTEVTGINLSAGAVRIPIKNSNSSNWSLKLAEIKWLWNWAIKRT